MTTTRKTFYSLLFRVTTGMLILSVYSCVTPPPPTPASTTYRPTTTINEWPYWTDIPTSKGDFDSIWKTVIDVVTEIVAIKTMDKEAGYIVTEWTNRGYSDEYRYTVKIYPEKKIVKYGYENRDISTQKYGKLPYKDSYTDIQSPWGRVYYPLRDRLQSVK
jgi:hypothetical protein